MEVKVMKEWGSGKTFLQSKESQAWTNLLDLFL
jgi:hypothetical protein